MIKKSILTLYTLILVCIGFATLLEKLYGTSFVSDSIYGSWWFSALWALLVIVAVIYICGAKLYKRSAVMLLHVSFIVILAGAMITHITAVRGTIHLRQGEKVNMFITSDNKNEFLPFTMQLDKFNIEFYPGTDAPMDYQSIINVTKDNVQSTINVSMNNIGNVDYYRFFQSAYDSDNNGTILGVSYDPYGIAVTYIGYFLLFVGFIWILASRKTRIRQLYKEALKPAVILLLLMSFPTGSNAQNVFTKVEPEIAHNMGKIVVNYNNRLCPMNTAATEFVTKLCGKSSWNGYSADEIFVCWMIYYTEWETQKIIRVKNDDVQRMIGVEGGWASVRDFYTPDNRYKLTDKSNDTSLPDATRKAIREADEKINVVNMFYNSEMLKMFPLTVNGKSIWYTPGSTELPKKTPYREFNFIKHAMDYLVKSILVNNTENANKLISKIRLYQRDKAGDIMPSKIAINAEVIYNCLQSARWIVFLSLTISLILCLLKVSGSKVANSKNFNIFFWIYTSVLAVYLTMILAIRWWISGHVPVSNGFETMLFMAWAIAMFTLFTAKKIDVIKTFGPILVSFSMLVAMLAGGNPEITQLMPVLHSPILSIHVMIVMVSYALFAIDALLAVQCLWLNRKHEANNAEINRLTALSQLFLYPAMACLGIGIFIGAIWANISWGTYWSWDPKETWALITFMVYAAPLHSSIKCLQSQRNYHVFMLLAFMTVLMTYFGVNYLLAGMHSYANV